jgi:hypothetical protein
VPENASAGRGPRLGWRAVGAALLVVSGAVHGYLYTAEDYRAIPTIGPLFLLVVVVAPVLAVVVVVAHRPITDVAGAIFALSVLGAYLLTLLVPTGLFLFRELGVSTSGALSLAAEGGAALSLGSAAARTVSADRRARLRPPT